MRIWSATIVRQLSLALFPDFVNLHNSCAGGEDVPREVTGEVCVTRYVHMATQSGSLQRFYTQKLQYN